MSDSATAERAQYNRKDPQPSRAMLPPDGRRYRCPWIEDSITVHADGNVSCGLDDPHARRSFGNLGRQSVQEVFANPEYDRLRAKLWDGHRCSDCRLYQVADDSPPAIRPALPTTAVIETTVKCNLRCPNAACDPNNDSTLRTRDRNELSLDQFRGIVDQMAGTLRHVYFFNYGEPFFNRDAADMLVHLRACCPGAQIITSTNAIPLAARGKAEKIVPCLDQVTVTLSGVAQASYVRYHVNGQVGQALAGLQNLCDAKRALGLSTPHVTWRYLLFRWNDSEAEIDAAVALARLYGVDQFQLYLTHIPAGASSYRFAPGSRLFETHRRLIDSAYGYPGTAGGDGLYPVETVPGLGRARWTGWRARLRLIRHGHWLRLSVATMRPDLGRGLGHCFVRLPWDTVKIAPQHGVWQHFSFLVPWALRGQDAFDCTVVTFDEWFPIEETGTDDTRCLGVLLGEEEDAIPDEQRFLLTLRLEPPSAQELRRLDALPPECDGLAQPANSGRFGA